MTHTNLEVPICCKNYEEIVSTGYDHNDYITEKLIEIYRDYVFQVPIEEFKTAEQIDQIMNEYISSKPFYQYVQNFYQQTDHMLVEITEIVPIYQEYIHQEFKNNKKTKWI